MSLGSEGSGDDSAASPGRRFGALALLLCLPTLYGLLLTGCGDVKSPTEPPAPGGGVPALTFEQIQGTIFTPRCAHPLCHASGSAPSGMVLEAGVSYSNIVGVRAVGNPAYLRVAPGDADRSYLIRKLRGEGDAGDRMPLDGPPYLTPDQIAGIAAWINAGAPR